MPCRSSNQSLTGPLAPQKPLYGQGATSGVREGGEGRDPSSLCGIFKSLLDTVSSLGLSSTRKVLSDRYKCSGGHGVKTKRQEKGLRGPGLLSLEKRRKMGDEGGGCSRWDRKDRARLLLDQGGVRSKNWNAGNFH